jgi:hypothetical protein
MDEEPQSKAAYQTKNPAKTSPSPSTIAETLRQNLESDKIHLDQLTQKNAAANEYVTSAEKAKIDVAKALDEYKKAVDKWQTNKRDADHANQLDVQDATTEIGAKGPMVDAAIRGVDQPLDDLQKELDDLPKKKASSETDFSNAQDALVKAQAAFQAELAYPTKLIADLKAVTDVQSKVQKANDHAHSAEFYFYANETAKLLKQISVKTPDELNADLSEKLGAYEQALANVIQAKSSLIDASVELGAKQKQFADLQKNRETLILASIQALNAPAAKPSETPARRSAK